ncbi:MAG: NAD(P)-dependent oxidoreductase [Actinomycetes bacterium]
MADSAAVIGFIGLGIMGSAMSGRLIQSGYEVLGFDLDAARMSEHAQRGGTAASSPAGVADSAHIVILSLPSSGALRSVFTGPQGICESQHPDLVLVETSTLALDDKLAARDWAASVGADLLDCPMSGTGSQARTGDLVAYLSGDDQSKRKAEPVLAAFTRSAKDVGQFGNGTKLKLIANLLVGVHNAAAGEALSLAQSAGLDPADALGALADGAGYSTMLGVRGPMMVSGEYLPATMTVDLFMKDLGLIASFAEGVGAATPLLDATTNLYKQASDQLLGKYDTAVVHDIIRDLQR